MWGGNVLTQAHAASEPASAAAPAQPAMSPSPQVAPATVAVAQPLASAAAAARLGQPVGQAPRQELPGGQQLAAGQRLESVGQRLSIPGGQRLESLAGANTSFPVREPPVSGARAPQLVPGTTPLPDLRGNWDAMATGISVLHEF